MPWSEVSPGRFERPCDNIEGFYITLLKPSEDGKEFREHWLITTVTKVRFESSEEEAVAALKNAWKTIRYDHPELACIVEGQRKIYQVADDATIDQWLAETFIIQSSITSEELLAMPKPTRLALCYFLPQTSEIAIVSSHWRVDGVGSLQLMNNFLRAVAEPREITFGKEGENLSPGIYEALRAPDGKPSAEADKAADDLVSIMTDNYPSIGLPIPPQKSSSAGFTRRIYRYLSVQATASFKAACKARNLSPTAATHAALAQAIHNISSNPTFQLSNPPTPSPGQNAAKKFISWALVDLRKYTHPPTSSPTNPITNYHGGTPVALDPQVPFLENARYLTEIYWHPWTTPWHPPPVPSSTNTPSPPPPPPLPPATNGNTHTHTHTAPVADASSLPPHPNPNPTPALLSILHPYIQKTISALLAPIPPGTPEPTHPTCSSLGVLDRYIQPTYAVAPSPAAPAALCNGTPPTPASSPGSSSSSTPGPCPVPKLADKKIKTTTIHIDDVWMGIETATGAWQRQPLVHTWVWRGRMYVGVCFDGGWIPEGVVRALIEEIWAVVGREMGVEMME